MNHFVLVAEDDEGDAFLLRRAFREAALAAALEFVSDGQEAIDFLQQKRLALDDRLPALVLLDLKMPRKNGLDVLQWIRRQPVLRCLPVMIFSSSDRREDVERAYTLGANAYMTKPPSIGERVEVAQFIKQWLQLNQCPMATQEGFKIAQSAHLANKFEGPPVP